MGGGSNNLTTTGYPRNAYHVPVLTLIASCLALISDVPSAQSKSNATLPSTQSKSKPRLPYFKYDIFVSKVLGWQYVILVQANLNGFIFKMQPIALAFSHVKCCQPITFDTKISARLRLNTWYIYGNLC